jgi:carbonic anhydrase/acetyltransferase-like protein (isoleucine patch superfamily)
VTGALIRPWRGIAPSIDPEAWLAPTATVIGDVEIGAGSSIWFGAILRGDVNRVRIGRGTNIQDGSVVHVTRTRFETIVGDDVLIGHMAMIHGCTIEAGAFVGMKACVMDGAVVAAGGMVAAGALVTPGKRVGSGELWAGTPARFVRRVSETEAANMREAPPRYAALAAAYREAGIVG